ncbi:hypothetical protein BDFB_014105, partial [Asbolus verrucosus]
TALVDGARNKRSCKSNYNALLGVGCIIETRTKKVLYMSVKNRFCLKCERNKSGKINKKHKCSINWNKTSTAMKSNILEGFQKSLTTHNLINGKITDGDGSMYKKICDAKPCSPNFFTEKIECRNHVLRNWKWQKGYF